MQTSRLAYRHTSSLQQLYANVVLDPIDYHCMDNFFFSIYLLLFSTNNDRIFNFWSTYHTGCTLRRFTYAKHWSCWHLQSSNIINPYHKNCCKVQKSTIKFGIFIILLGIFFFLLYYWLSHLQLLRFEILGFKSFSHCCCKVRGGLSLWLLGEGQGSREIKCHYKEKI